MPEVQRPSLPQRLNPSLRHVLLVGVASLSLLAMTAAGALIVLTDYLREISAGLSAATRSVGLVRELELSLLTHARAQDELVQTHLARELREGMRAARSLIGSVEEQQLLDEAATQVERYLQGSSPSADAAWREDQLRSAFTAITAFVQMNVAQAGVAQTRAARLNRLADWLGYSVAAALLAGTGVVLVWFLRAAIAPLLRLREVLARFAAGDRETRVPETGPAELREIAAQFNTMAHALDRQRSAQLAFLAGVAHDIRNPLSALSATAALLAPGRPLPPEPRVRALAEVVRRQVETLDRMVGDLVDEARIEAGQLELRAQTRDARAAAREAHELFRAATSLHQLELLLPDAPVAIQCDPVRLAQVLNNLISNAIKYSPRGGRIQIAVESAREEVIFRVSDQGIGIATEELQSVFQPFRRTRRSRTTAPGTGLGLSVAKRIVEAHGGRILLDSEVQRGTTARVILPRADVELPAEDDVRIRESDGRTQSHERAN